MAKRALVGGAVWSLEDGFMVVAALTERHGLGEFEIALDIVVALWPPATIRAFLSEMVDFRLLFRTCGTISEISTGFEGRSVSSSLRKHLVRFGYFD